jgi:lipoyl synthase
MRKSVLTMIKDKKISIKKPKWLRRRPPSGSDYEKINLLVKSQNLNTVCQEARCPNQFECFSKKTATFLILGSKCTRNCKFCSIDSAPPVPLDFDEPKRVAEAAKKMNLSYVVVTSVTRDDISDGGASIFAETIKELRKNIPNVLIEVLIPDFQGDEKSLEIVLNEMPDVLNHNIETVKRLYTKVRPEADYERSLDILKKSKKNKPQIICKSGIMVGLGEQKEEVIETFQDLLNSGCDILTIGQYLQPTREHLSVKAFIEPKEFENFREIAIKMGFKEAASGPFVRSSYKAKEIFMNVK